MPQSSSSAPKVAVADSVTIWVVTIRDNSSVQLGQGTMAMKRIIAAAGLFVLLADGLIGQTAEARPEFDVADIRQNKSGNSDSDGGILPGGQFGVRNAPLKVLLGFAYGNTNRFIDTY